MVSTFTTARGLEKPAAGDQVGTWGTATVNPNMDVVDASAWGTTIQSVTAGSVVLTAAQCRNARITLSSTLTGSITITFLTSINGPYTILNSATGSSNFTITLNTTAAGGRAVGCPPGMFDIWNDGTNIDFRNAASIGSYLDYAGSSVPNWVPACSVPPLLNCDGTTFSSATYPQLAVIMGGTTLPDLRGRVRAYLNQGTGRMVSGQGGVDGNTILSASGFDTTTLSSVNIPNYALPVTDPGHIHTYTLTRAFDNVGGDSSNERIGRGQEANVFTGKSSAIASATTGITVNSGGSGTAFSRMQPTAIGGITMIRAA